MTPAAMAVIHERAFASQGRGWSADEFEQLLKDDHVFCVHRQMGFAIGRVTGDDAELLTLATDPEAQGKGVGRGVMQDFANELLRRGVQTVFLEVARDNTAALALYDSLGYSQIGCRKAYYRSPDGTFVDAFVLSRGI